MYVGSQDAELVATTPSLVTTLEPPLQSLAGDVVTRLRTSMTGSANRSRHSNRGSSQGRLQANREAPQSQGSRRNRAPGALPRFGRFAGHRGPLRAARTAARSGRRSWKRTEGTETPGVRGLLPPDHLRQAQPKDRDLRHHHRGHRAGPRERERLPGGGLARRSKGHSGGPICPSERRLGRPRVPHRGLNRCYGFARTGSDGVRLVLHRCRSAAAVDSSPWDSSLSSTAGAARRAVRTPAPVPRRESE
jgi:hypothetical protein